MLGRKPLRLFDCAVPESHFAQSRFSICARNSKLAGKEAAYGESL